MKILYDWLKEFVAVPFAAEELRERLSLAGIAVEGLAQSPAGPILGNGNDELAPAFAPPRRRGHEANEQHPVHARHGSVCPSRVHGAGYMMGAK